MILAHRTLLCVLSMLIVQSSHATQLDSKPVPREAGSRSHNSASHYVAVAQLNQGRAPSNTETTDFPESAHDSSVNNLGSTATPTNGRNLDADRPTSAWDPFHEGASEAPLRIGRSSSNEHTIDNSLPSANKESMEAGSSVPLKPPTKRTGLEAVVSNRPFGVPTDKLITVGSSLAIVLGLFFLLMLFSRRNGNKPIPHLSKDVFEILGRAAFVGKQQLYLVRLGNKLTLWSVSSGVTKSLVEVDDPQEVERIGGLCQKGKGGQMSATFQEILARMNTDARVRRS